MIPVRGHQCARVAVLGLGRSGRTAVAALAAGGAVPLSWDESAEARARAEAEGIVLTDLSRADWGGAAALIVSPGIPHLYPAPNAIVAAAMEAGVPLDNDIGLFFRSVATPDWDGFDPVPRVIAVTGSNGKSTTAALIPADGGGDAVTARREYRARRAGHGRGRAGSWCWSCRPTRRNWRGR